MYAVTTYPGMGSPLVCSCLVTFFLSAPLGAQEPKPRAILGDGHAGVATSMTFGPDETLLASWGRDRTVRVWEIASGTSFATFTDPTAEVAAARFGPGGDTLLLASLDGTVRSWDFGTGKTKVVCKVPVAGISGLALSADGGLLASESVDGRLRLWDARTGKEKVSVRSVRPDILEFSRDGTLLVASAGGDVVVLDTKTLEHQVRPRAITGRRERTPMAVSPDGKSLALIARDGTGGVTEVRSLEGGKPTVLGVASQVAMLAFSPDGRTLAASIGQRSQGFTSSAVMLHDLDSGGQRPLYIMVPAGHALHAVAFSPSGKTLAVSSTDGDIFLHDPATRRSKGVLARWRKPVHSIAISPDGKLLAAETLPTVTNISPAPPSFVRVFDLATNKRITTLENVRRPAFSPDGSLLGVQTWDEVQLWKVADRAMGQALRALPSSFAFSPDGKTVAAANPYTHTIALWDTATGKQTKLLQGPRDRVNALAFSPDGRMLASTPPGQSGPGRPSGDSAVRLWEVETGKNVTTFTAPAGFLVGLSPDGKVLAAVERDQRCSLRDVAAGRRIAVLRCRPHPTPYPTFSPDGKLLALFEDDGAGGSRIQLYDPASGKLTATATAHTWGKVTRPVFSPDGRRLASIGADNVVRVWDVAGRREAGVLTGHTGPVLAVAFTPDGARLASAGEDGLIRVWDLPPREGGK